MDNNEAPDKSYNKNDNFTSLDKKHVSLSSLIMWNISKALEEKPDLDLRFAMRLALERLEKESSHVNTMMSQCPQDRHVTCAVLAWQQLGHKDTESLYEFVNSRRSKTSRNVSEKPPKKENIYTVNTLGTPKRPKGFIDHKPSVHRDGVDSGSFDTHSLIGPVVKLPVEAKVVMRVENTSPCVRHNAKKQTKAQKSDVANKLDAACCLDSACVERLKELESATAELRSRAGKLAHREAERVELLERAEAAWRDLEIGYQRRLVLAEEKEDDIAKQIKKLIEDRNAYKHACTTLAQQLSKRGDIVEADRTRLTQVEKQVCDLACTRMRLSEESAKGDAAVADQQCKAVQLERDLQFKEEQARRKLLSVESVVDSSRGLTLEAERAMRQELGNIKEQIAQVSQELLDEDAENNRIKIELEELRQQKTEIFEDLEGCKQMCDNRMQGKVDELNKKRQQLNELKDKAIDCQCKLPLHVSVEAKRTPSLAALCLCTAEEKILHACSCTSVRSTLLSNLLSDLFGGLQAELGDTGSLMPCQLLKCLEDKHNWDRASVVKSNLRSFFSRLLVGELDTAIATSIEKYHATWVGVSCADKAKMTPEPDEDETEGWQERALERRAQKLAAQLAEELFQDRADQLIQKAKDIVTSGPPPCECTPQSNRTTAYPCLIKTPTVGGTAKRSDINYHPYFKRAVQDVTILRTQIEDLKKESIKKEDLRIMEKKLTKIVQQASEPDNISNNINSGGRELNLKTIHTAVNTEDLTEEYKRGNMKKKINKIGLIKSVKKSTDSNGMKEKLFDSKMNKKSFKKIGQSYAVNLCLCDVKNNVDNGLQHFKCSDNLNSCIEKVSQSVLAQLSSNKYTKPLSKMLSKDNQNSKSRRKLLKTTKCPNNCKCFHKVPSNTSIDKLLGTLVKWRGDLLNSSIFNTVVMTKSNEGVIKEIHHDSEFSNNKKSININEMLNEKCENVSEAVHTESSPVPPVTTSEYVGAINLDKSDELTCNSDAKHENICENQTKIISNENILYKFINKSKSISKQNGIKKKYSARLDKETISIIDNKSNIKSMGLFNKNKNDEYNVSVKNLLNVGKSNSKCLLLHKNNQTSESNHLPYDGDCRIKFLGVTVTDVCDRSNSIPRKEYQNVFDKISSNCNNQSDICAKMTSNNKFDKVSNKNSQLNRVQSINKKSNYLCKIDFCKYDEINASSHQDATKIIDNKLEKHQNKEENFHDINSCVCCNNDDETKNLEINTFYLLEKHLKHKLVELRKSSTGILEDEEEKVFLTILDRVKQVISKCTNNVKCECSVKNNNSGSWVRVNNLLEEYLKMKIKRVQCSCVPNYESIDTVLPSILKQVSNLIENDFEQLKYLFKNNTNKSYITKPDSQLNLVAKNFGCNEINCNEPLTVVKNVSIQDVYDLEIEDKSCDAIEVKESKDIQTSQSNLNVQLNPNEVIITHCYNCVNDELVFKTSSNDNIKEPESGTIKIGSQHVMQDNSSVNKTEVRSRCSLSVPYVGCTLSCTCENNMGPCVCSKSMSQAYIKNINKIWKMLEINKKLLPNMSYIMHSMPQRVRSENIINFVEVTDPAYVPVISETQSTKIISVSDEEEIILKNSDDKLKQSDINDNMTNTLDDLISVTTECLNDDDDPLYWYDCCSSLRNAKNEMTHKKAFYDSVYSPITKSPRRGKSDSSFKNNVTMCISRSKNCNCVMVPVCHVKKLVENIESRLVNYQCTCDSLSSQICPLHSKIA